MKELRVTGMIGGGVACVFCGAHLIPPVREHEPEPHVADCSAREAAMKASDAWEDDIGEVCSDGELNAALAAWLAANGKVERDDAADDAIMESAQYLDEDETPAFMTELEYAVGGSQNLPRDSEGRITAF